MVVTFFPLEGELDLCRGHDPDRSIDDLFVCLFVCSFVLRYMHCTHTTAHSNDTVKHTDCLAQAGLKYLAQVTDKKAD